MTNLILIDFSWLYNRYYYVAKFNNQESREPVEPTLTRMLGQFLTLVNKSYEGAKVVMALDSPTSVLINSKLCKEYKQNRDKEGKKEVYSCLNSVLNTLINKLDPKVFLFARAQGFEADQIIAYYAKKYQSDRDIIIYSGDKDLLQLTYYKKVQVSDKFEKGKFIIKSDKEIFEKFKNSKGEDFTRISTNKKDILKYRVLKGDQSDNLKSVFPRIKDVEIVDIIKNYWIDNQEEGLSLSKINNIIDNIRGTNAKLADKLQENADTWYTNYKIMNLYEVEGIKVKRVKNA